MLGMAQADVKGPLVYHPHAGLLPQSQEPVAIMQQPNVANTVQSGGTRLLHNQQVPQQYGMPLNSLPASDNLSSPNGHTGGLPMPSQLPSRIAHPEQMPMPMQTASSPSRSHSPGHTAMDDSSMQQMPHASTSGSFAGMHELPTSSSISAPGLMPGLEDAAPHGSLPAPTTGTDLHADLDSQDGLDEGPNPHA